MALHHKNDFASLVEFYFAIMFLGSWDYNIIYQCKLLISGEWCSVLNYSHYNMQVKIKKNSTNNTFTAQTYIF